MKELNHQEKLEEVLALLINEESEEASELLHSIIVDKAKAIHNEVIGESEVEDEDEDELEENFGGDKKADFANDIDADKDEVDAEETYEADDEADDDEDMEDMDDEDMDFDDDGELDDHEEEHGDVEDRVEDLEAALAELTAEFEELVGGDMDLDGDLDGDGDDMDSMDDMDDMDALDSAEDDMDFKMSERLARELDEATDFLNKVADTGQGSEGKLTGTGNKSSAGAVNAKSVHSQSKRKDYGGKPDNILGSTADEKGMKAKGAKDHTPGDNVDVDPESAPKAKEKPEHDDKSAESTLTKAPGARK